MERGSGLGPYTVAVSLYQGCPPLFCCFETLLHSDTQRRRERGDDGVFFFYYCFQSVSATREETEPLLEPDDRGSKCFRK